MAGRLYPLPPGEGKGISGWTLVRFNPETLCAKWVDGRDFFLRPWEFDLYICYNNGLKCFAEGTTVGTTELNFDFAQVMYHGKK